MTLDRSLVLDLFLGLSVTVVVLLYGNQDTGPLQRWMAAIGMGAGTILFARYFIRRFFLPPHVPSKADLVRQLERVEAYLENTPQIPQEQRIPLLEQAGALALALEQWPRIIHHYQDLSTLLEEEIQAQPDEAETLRRRWFHTQMALCFALHNNHQEEESLTQLRQLQETAERFSEPIFSLLIELFQARVISRNDPAQGEAMLNQALATSRQEGYEEDALRLVASEWLEWGHPKEAIPLLQRAQILAQERDDRLVETEVLFLLGLAYSAADHLPQAAQVLVQLTQTYIHSNMPTAEQLDLLRDQLCERFGKAAFREAYSTAKEQSAK